MKHDMPNTNVAIVQGLFEAFGRGDMGAILTACAPDIEWEVVGSPADFPPFGLRKGLAGVESFFQDVVATHTFQSFAPGPFHAAGDHVFVPIKFEMTVTRTGRKVSSRFFCDFELQGGKIKRQTEYLDTAALAAAYRA
jgi:uncharacterized protein